MGFIDKVKRGLRSLKWVASKNGREYRKSYKTNKEGIEICCEKENVGEDHKHEEVTKK